MTPQRYLPADALQVALGLACLAVAIVAYPVEYEDFPHYSPASVQYQHAAPLVKHLVVEKYAHPKYEFKYGVNDQHTGDIKEQSEQRDGDVVKGQYSLVEPDGTTRTVKYTSDKHNGFNAEVIKSGHATHPPSAPKKAEAPVVFAHQPLGQEHAPLSFAAHEAELGGLGGYDFHQ
ncbi:hypothetical protein B7P43_G13676 [Cryptotermes secundus]|uniref:Cuticle protein 19 n=1 Tax=Cryptotermes secundus TaxID=105785 RepID=A0A2J7RMC4_9NEOP|nr:hypothetical protein B7P43_G13676 [Cryptotermes secundus]